MTGTTSSESEELSDLASRFAADLLARVVERSAIDFAQVMSGFLEQSGASGERMALARDARDAEAMEIVARALGRELAAHEPDEQTLRNFLRTVQNTEVFWRCDGLVEAFAEGASAEWIETLGVAALELSFWFSARDAEHFRDVRWSRPRLEHAWPPHPVEAMFVAPAVGALDLLWACSSDFWDTLSSLSAGQQAFYLLFGRPAQSASLASKFASDAPSIVGDDGRWSGSTLLPAALGTWFEGDSWRVGEIGTDRRGGAKGVVDALTQRSDWSIIGPLGLLHSRRRRRDSASEFENELSARLLVTEVGKITEAHRHFFEPNEELSESERSFGKLRKGDRWQVRALANLAGLSNDNPEWRIPPDWIREQLLTAVLP